MRGKERGRAGGAGIGARAAMGGRKTVQRWLRTLQRHSGEREGKESAREQERARDLGEMGVQREIREKERDGGEIVKEKKVSQFIKTDFTQDTYQSN